MKLSIETADSESPVCKNFKLNKCLLSSQFVFLSKKDDYYFRQKYCSKIEAIRFKMMYGIILEICSTFKITEEAYFLSLEIFDEYCFKSNLNILSELEIECIFLCSFSLATKLLESNQKYVDILMVKSISREYKDINFKNIEQDILTKLDFNLNLINSFEFLKLIFELNLNVESTNYSFEKEQQSKIVLFNKAKEILLTVLLHNIPLKLTNLELAVSIFALLRKKFSFEDLIPFNLETICQISKEFINDVCIKILEEEILKINPHFCFK